MFILFEFKDMVLLMLENASINIYEIFCFCWIHYSHVCILFMCLLLGFYLETIFINRLISILTIM